VSPQAPRKLCGRGGWSFSIFSMICRPNTTRRQPLERWL
jgi:hypothetical protein